MKKKSLLMLALALCLILCACEPDYSPKVSMITMAPGESIVFSALPYDIENDMVWVLDGEIVAEGPSEYVFVAEAIGDDSPILRKLSVQEVDDKPLLNLFGFAQNYRRKVRLEWTIKIMPSE